jgi:4-methyl-5(b-hydroxyethyl)-thiazole monophosphate biosynthesis
MFIGQATCHPSFMEKLASYTTSVESRVQLDGRVVTSRAPGTTMEFAVAIVEQLYGKEKADEVAGPLVRSKDSTFVIILLVF